PVGDDLERIREGESSRPHAGYRIAIEPVVGRGEEEVGQYTERAGETAVRLDVGVCMDVTRARRELEPIGDRAIEIDPEIVTPIVGRADDPVLVLDRAREIERRLL